MAEIDKLLVVGSGGREFALMQEALESDDVGQVYSTRGNNAVNIGIEDVVNTGIGDKDIQTIGSFAVEEDIDLVIVSDQAGWLRRWQGSRRLRTRPARRSPQSLRYYRPRKQRRLLRR